ncbi:MAG TPA: transcriptional regulator [Bacillota bacterium]|nr:transcriptional regulator [Bacillota bacterium]
MTEIQQKIYNAIREFIQVKGYSPSVREIGAIVGLRSSATIHEHLTKIRRQGYIDFEPGKSRTLRVLKDRL